MTNVIPKIIPKITPEVAPSKKTAFHRPRLETGRAVLAPMAGFSDAPFRLLCREFGAAWAVTEMVSSIGVVMNGKKSFEIGERSEERRVGKEC